MNIQTLLSEIKQAKKRRVILDYHPSPVSGVDVMAKDWKASLVLFYLKQITALLQLPGGAKYLLPLKIATLHLN